MSAKVDTLPKRITTSLQRHFAKDTIIDVSPSGVRNNLHVLVVSRELDNMSEPEKQEHLWGLLDDAVKKKSFTKKELERVSLVLPVSVDELRR